MCVHLGMMDAIEDAGNTLSGPEPSRLLGGLPILHERPM